MAPVGSTVFAVLLWGALAGVALVACYEVYVVLHDADWIGG